MPMQFCVLGDDWERACLQICNCNTAALASAGLATPYDENDGSESSELEFMFAPCLG